MKRMLLLLIGMLGQFATILCAQDDDVIRAAMYICGAQSEEDVDPYLVEKLEQMKLFPVNVNRPRRGAGVILSEYQLASLKEYRGRQGDILSAVELSLVDGFPEDFVRVIKPFITFSSSKKPGSTDTVKTRGSILTRITEKNIGAKIKIRGEDWGAAAALRGEDYTVSLSGSLGPWSIVLGDYNLRFGEGLLLWSGFVIESLGSIEAFCRRPSGITPRCSFLPREYRGAALSFESGGFKVDSYYSLDRRAGLHGEWRGLRGGAGLSFGRSGISITGRYTPGPLSLSLEAAIKAQTPALRFNALYGANSWRLALQGRYVPSTFSGKKYGEYAIALGAEWKRKITITADASLLPIPVTAPSRQQLKIRTSWNLFPYDNEKSVLFAYYGRIRNYEPPRNEVSAAAKYETPSWIYYLKVNALYCTGPGVLARLETARKWKSLSLYGAAILYSTSSWQSRVYCYDRDAPGAFSVPAFYGTGANAGAYLSCKKRFWDITFKACAKLACNLKINKEGSLESRFQLVMEF